MSAIETLQFETTMLAETALFRGLSDAIVRRGQEITVTPMLATADRPLLGGDVVLSYIPRTQTITQTIVRNGEKISLSVTLEDDGSVSSTTNDPRSADRHPTNRYPGWSDLLGICALAENARMLPRSETNPIGTQQPYMYA